MKSQKLLDSFVEYCQNHPDERFWQALRNWSEHNFIRVSKKLCSYCKDTYYWNGKRGFDKDK